MLLVHGPRSTSYDFGPGHPLTPRRFGPGIGLLRALGAEPGLAPEPASDVELRSCHTDRYIELVRAFSVDPGRPAAAGIGFGGDTPPFAAMHAAAAAVAGGSLRAVEAILRGDVEHAFHPGGGLHHAMPGRASGFCVYDDPALAVARARRDGLRVMYVDLDVHHGDGVQAIHVADPGVMTISIHETGRSLFPGTGEVDEFGSGTAAGTSVNVPLEPGSGERAWLAALERLLPELAAAFGPDLIVSQHGADSHAWDPLAHLRVTTTAMGAAARLVDRLAHRHAGGRWLATGGGGYDVYRVVPRTWSLVWLAGSHRDVPEATPAAWRERWAGEAVGYGQGPPPATFGDPANAGLPIDDDQVRAEARSTATADLVRRLAVPRLLREARDRGWWDPDDPVAGGGPGGSATTEARALATADRIEVGPVDADGWDRVDLGPRVVSPLDPAVARSIVLAALQAGSTAWAATVRGEVVGLALAGPAHGGRRELLAVGVAPAFRRRGLAAALLSGLVGATPAGVGLVAEATLAERDPIEPLSRAERAGIAGRLLAGAGFDRTQIADDIRMGDPEAITARRLGGETA